MKGTEDLLKEREGFSSLRAVKNVYKTHGEQVARLLKYDDFIKGQKTSLVASICALYGIGYCNTPKYYPNMAFIEFLIRCLKAFVRGNNPKLTAKCAQKAVGIFLEVHLPKLIAQGKIWNCVRHVGQEMRDKLTALAAGAGDISSTKSHRTVSRSITSNLFRLDNEDEVLIDHMFNAEHDDSEIEDIDDDNGELDRLQEDSDDDS